MLFINISGRGPHKVCENVVSWFVSKYLPRHKLTINVNHRGLKREAVDGWCWVEDCDWNPREFAIELQTGLPREHYIQTLLHELQHVEEHVEVHEVEFECNVLWEDPFEVRLQTP